MYEAFGLPTPKRKIKAASASSRDTFDLTRNITIARIAWSEPREQHCNISNAGTISICSWTN